MPAGSFARLRRAEGLKMRHDMGGKFIDLLGRAEQTPSECARTLRQVVDRPVAAAATSQRHGSALPVSVHVNRLTMSKDTVTFQPRLGYLVFWTTFGAR
jgi:hypothetical protein